MISRLNCKKNKIENGLVNVIKIESLDNNAQGVARIDTHVQSNSTAAIKPTTYCPNKNQPIRDIVESAQASSATAKSTKKVLFIKGALPGEVVEYKIFQSKTNYTQAIMTKLLESSWQRVKPECQFFGTCGGCNMQHLDILGQIAVKQRLLEDALSHIGKVQAEEIYRPIIGFDWHYRYRARLSVQYLAKTNDLLIGFFKRKSISITNIQNCKILPLHVSNLIEPLRYLIIQLSLHRQIDFIEVTVNEKSTHLNFGLKNEVKIFDQQKINAFALHHQIEIGLQYKKNNFFEILGAKTKKNSQPENKNKTIKSKLSQLFYNLPEFDLTIFFKPGDFTQVNPVSNQRLVSRTIGLLSLKCTDKVLDMFCGLGNFTLPIARLADFVTGIDSNPELIERAKINGIYNHLNNCAGFICSDLFEFGIKQLKNLGYFNKWVIDPPRVGAYSIVKTLAEASINKFCSYLPNRIVYVSCNPVSLARDANILVNHANYQLAGAGIINMFPHTSHVESIAVFDLKI